jgi:pimeloyl-ACP methyl ester carboxylesterase
MATTQQARDGAYLDVGDVHTYYEVRGAGDAVILLHGGMCTAETFDGQAPALAEHYRVYVPERRGHGRTADVDGPITYEVMARDTIDFIEAADTGPAHLVGWSDGAIVGLLVALERPELVRKLVLIGQYSNDDGASPAVKAMVDSFTPDSLPPFLRQLYEAVSPDGPDHFGVVFDKLLPSWRADPGITLEQLGGVQAPTLVLLGDSDLVTPEYGAAMARAIPQAQLGVVPGASHGLPMEKPEVVNRLVHDFLAEGTSEKTFV